MPVVVNAELIKKEQLKPDIFKYSIKSKEIAEQTKPGQFLEIRVTNGTAPFLRRPISIHNVEQEIVEFIFQVRGEGTKLLSQKQEGDIIDVMGPLGNGAFVYSKYQNIAIIGGGIGVFPLYELAKRAKENANIQTYLGFRNKEIVVLEEEFKGVSDKLTITTDDGSYGKGGFAINYLKEDIEKQKPDCIFACGPTPMLKAVKELAKEMDVKCQISLEEKMACGIGACLGCAVKINQDGEQTFGRVCTNGPVFFADEVEI